MKKIFAFSLLIVALAACNKDKFQTKPQIKIKSQSSEVVGPNTFLRVVLEFTDKEGDLELDSAIVLRKQRLNKRVVTPTLRDVVYLELPQFPNNNLGEIELDLDYQNHLISAQTPPNIPGTNPQRKESDTLRLKFVLKDKAGNVSDTAETNVIVLRN